MMDLLIHILDFSVSDFHCGYKKRRKAVPNRQTKNRHTYSRTEDYSRQAGLLHHATITADTLRSATRELVSQFKIRAAASTIRS